MEEPMPATGGTRGNPRERHPPTGQSGKRQESHLVAMFRKAMMQRKHEWLAEESSQAQTQREVAQREEDLVLPSLCTPASYSEMKEQEGPPVRVLCSQCYRRVDPRSLSRGETSTSATVGKELRMRPQGPLRTGPPSPVGTTTRNGAPPPPVEVLQGVLANRNGTLRLCDTSLRGNRKEIVDEITKSVAAQCVRDKSRQKQADVFLSSLDYIEELYPSLFGILSLFRKYITETVDAMEEQDRNRVAELQAAQERAFHDQERLFEQRFIQVLQDKRKAEKAAKEMSEALWKMREERDGDLMDAKNALLRSMNHSEHQEDEFRSFRSLIASVFQVNLKLTNRLDELQKELARHGIPIPPTDPSLFSYSTATNIRSGDQDGVGGAPPLSEPTSSDAALTLGSRSPTTASTPSHFATQATEPSLRPEKNSVKVWQSLLRQVPLNFVEASQKELSAARLTLQRELLTCAYDSREALRQQICLLRGENAELRVTNERQVRELEELERFVYTQRFQSYHLDKVYIKTDRVVGDFIDSSELADSDVVRVGGKSLKDDGGTVSGDAALVVSRDQFEGDGTGVLEYDEVPRRCLTPRPLHVPFAVQNELGIDLKRPSACIMSELSIVGLNLKHQLDVAMSRWRKLSLAMSWVNENVLQSLDLDKGSSSEVILTAPSDEWANTHHFLRTLIHPSVPNLHWSESKTAEFIFHFFIHYQQLRQSCRFTRDNRMLAPRQCQTFERCYNSMVPLDATKEDVERSIDRVPVGYVMTYFIRQELLGAKLEPSALGVLQAGTFSTRYVYRGENRIIEMEAAKTAYNLWASAQRYQHSQPLCKLFLDVCDGAMPLQIFDETELVVNAISAKVKAVALGEDGLLSCSQVNKTVMGMVADLPASQWWRAMLAISQTLRANGTPSVGRCSMRDMLATEIWYGAQASTGSPSVVVHRTTNFTKGELSGTLPTNSSWSSVPSSLPLISPASGLSSTKVGVQSASTHDVESCDTRQTALHPSSDLASQKRRSETPVGAAAAGAAPSGPAQRAADGEGQLLGAVGVSLTSASPTAAERAHPSGASFLIRHMRQIVLERYELVYSTIEGALRPLCRESETIRGLCLVHIHEAIALLSEVEQGSVVLKSPQRGTASCQQNPPEWRFHKRGSPDELPQTQLAPEGDLQARGREVSRIDTFFSESAFMEESGGRDSIDVASWLRKHRQGSGKPHHKYPTSLPGAFRTVCASLPQYSVRVHFPSMGESGEAALSHSGGGCSNDNEGGKSGSAEDQENQRKGAKAIRSPATRGASADDRDRVKSGSATRRSEKSAPKKRKKSSARREAHGTGGNMDNEVKLTSSGDRDYTPAIWFSSSHAAEDDKVLVEWYGFFAALRRTVLPMQDTLFIEAQRYRDRRKRQARRSGSRGGSHADGAAGNSCVHSDESDEYLDEYVAHAHH